MGINFKSPGFLAGFTAIFLIAIGIVQVILGEFVTKSVALTANGIDCIGDGFVSSIVWVGLKYFHKPEDHKFHYGYYKLENMASIFAAGVMILLAIYIAFRSYQQLMNPHEIETPAIGIAIALFAGIVAIIIGVIKIKHSKHGNAQSAKLEAINTVKDGTASLLAVSALLLSAFLTPVADAIIGFVIAIIIVSIAFLALKEASLMLVDACDNACIDKREIIRTIAEDDRHVTHAHVVRIRRAGPYIMGELEIEVPGDMYIRQVDHVKTKIEKHVHQAIPEMKKLNIITHPEGKHPKKNN